MAKKVFDLSAIRSPKDLKTLSVEDLPLLCKALRDEMIASVSQTGGHLASSLGAVELIVALHYVFNAPLDKIVFDVGHQAYAHKMLTGRLARFKTLRQFHGLSGFPKRAESSYDAFGTAHSSTSISAALGMAVADALAGRDAWHIAVIGDGALTGGMALEALNHAGAYKSGMKLLIILNDNDCSISPSVGAIRQHLAHLVSGKTYTAVRSLSKNLLSNIPTLKHIVKSMEQRTINFVSPPSTLFSAFDIKYYGPVDGHDVKGLVALLENISQVEGPIVLHICTEKGKGYDKAEKDPTLYHGVAPFDAEVGVIKRDAKLTYTDVFSEWICRAGKANDRLYAITPAMREGSGLVAFEKQFPDRYRDVAIAEQHAVTFAAGLAAAGMHPVVALYSTFAQRAYDQILHDVAIQNLPVTFAFDRAGIVGADGETHQGVFDLAYMRSIPNVVIMAPANAQSAVAMLDLSLNLKAPSVVRYPRASANVKSYPEDVTPVTFGRAACIRKTTKKTKTACVFAFGFMVEHLREVCEALDVTLYDMRFIKPVDRETIREAALSHDYLFTAEDSVLEGGAGSAVIEALAQMHIVKPVTQFALPDFFVGAGQTRELLTENGLDPESIKARICEVCERPSLEVLENVSLQDKNTMGVPALARY
ncbi:MAG TPA: 1-deoxy-D-xylulose-5-phosphate synthase, partial [Sutterella sp.]|nr:1-deoxy-D-xylulose-5-phosphate synthase [Sutterella sp.]